MGVWNDPRSDMSSLFKSDSGNDGFDNEFEADNPDLNEDSTGKVSVFSSNAKKCPSCGANLFFEPRLEVLLCRNCGRSFDPQTMDMRGSLGIENEEQEYGTDEDIPEEDEDKQEIVCNSCGARVVVDKTVSASICTFCGSPALIARRLTKEYRPDKIIPFDIDHDAAVDIFINYVNSVDGVPKKFKSRKVISKMSGVYVPTWLISADVSSGISGKAYINDRITRRNNEQARKARSAAKALLEVALLSRISRRAVTTSISTDNLPEDIGVFVSADVNFGLKYVPFDGGKHIADRLIAAAEPFDYSKLVPFNSSYLSGFYAQRYDEKPIDMTDKIYNRFDKYAHQVASNAEFKGFGSFDLTGNVATRYSNESVTYCLLPVWFLNIEYRGKDYKFIINGETGKVSGELPYTPVAEKITKAREGYNSFKLMYRGAFYVIKSASWFVLFFASYILMNIWRSVGNLPYMAYFLLSLTLLVFATKVLPSLVVNIHDRISDKRRQREKSCSYQHDLADMPDVETYYNFTRPCSMSNVMFDTSTYFERLNTDR